MARGSDQEKTEKATQKRREDARRKGEFAQSREIPTVLILFVGVGTFFFAGSWMFRRMAVLMKGVFNHLAASDFGQGAAHAMLVDLAGELLMILAPLALAISMAGIAANVLQKGFLFNTDLLAPRFSRLSPLQGLKRMVSFRSLVELLKSLFKVFFVGGIAFLLVRAEMRTLPGLILMEVPNILAFIGESAFRIVLFTCLAFLMLALADFLFQRWQHEQDLRMTKQEVREEAKQREGDPFIKARIRRVQMEMVRKRMMEAVKTADVVVTNPTHLAVALRYVPQSMHAPQLVGKGAGFMAERIKTAARESGIPIVENKSLARALFKTVEIGQTVPADMYRAVAEVLAYVYRLKGRHAF